MKPDYQKILFIAPHYKNHRGGIGAVVEEYSRNIVPFQFLASYNYGGKLYIIFHYFTFLFRFVFYLVSHPAVKIVHLHSSSRGSFYRKSVVVLISKLFGKKTIFHIHGSEFNLFYNNSGIMKGYVRKILLMNDRIICLSPQWYQFVNEFIPAAKLRILNNPVALSIHTREPKTTNRLQFLFLGRIGHRKGIFDILTALSGVDAVKREKIVLMAGGDGEIERFQNTIKVAGLDNCVNYVGWVDGTRKMELLKTSDVYILPSYHEGLPVSILEAMSYGMPVISSPVGGIPEVVKDGVNGFLVEAGDTVNLGKAIEKMIDTPQLIIEQGAKSSELVKPFLANAVFPELDKIYAEVLV